ncbi:MAG: hypothetical protein GEU96_22510, partial [Propionibacteriales bacterium]|nr:hypothetical protein [Propionibacteriales bacterium]
MTMVDDGLRFWLDYVDASGGLWEAAGDSAVVVLPATLQQENGGTDQLTVTSDPDVAREDGATLLAAGHPYLARAAEAVLDDGDCGVMRLASPLGLRPPSTDQLLAWARDQVPVDHGKIDATTGATPGVRYVLRVGTLATYTISADDHFQEQVERWVDVPSRLTFPEPVVARLSRLVYDERRDGDGGLPPAAELAAALAYAHEQIGARTREREAELSTQLGDACGRETRRALTYYDEALQSLQRRLDSAPPERAGTLSARMSSTRAERDRRLAEIAEKYQAQTTVRPFRLHVVGVPVMRLPVDVRRGDRRFPLTLDWLMPARTFAGMRCPHCASTEPLSVAKTRLGCRRCLAKPDAPRTTKPTPAQAARAPATTDAAPPPPAVPTSTPAEPRRADR